MFVKPPTVSWDTTGIGSVRALLTAVIRGSHAVIEDAGEGSRFQPVVYRPGGLELRIAVSFQSWLISKSVTADRFESLLSTASVVAA